MADEGVNVSYLTAVRMGAAMSIGAQTHSFVGAATLEFKSLLVFGRKKHGVDKPKQGKSFTCRGGWEGGGRDRGIYLLIQF